MTKNNWSPVEERFFQRQDIQKQTTKIPYILVDNFPDLGFLTSLRFLEWVSENQEGVISLPTGKTPEYFIKWTHHLLNNWDAPDLKKLRKENGLDLVKKPDLSRLKFVQIDEFYPMDSSQHNSFFNYVNNFYLEGFELSKENALLINGAEIPLADAKQWIEVFPNGTIDLTLRYRDPRSELEKAQQNSIYLIDQWCTEYEEKIRAMGGIGFFLGGIGPDGHIAFNVRGSDHNSTTRLMETNFETQAAAATDLGGIEISKNRLVITIGLATITFNEDAVVIITAAGEAKATIVKHSLENLPDVKYPGTVLQRLDNSRFYLTYGAAKSLQDTENKYWETPNWDDEKRQRALLQLAKNVNIFGKKLSLKNLENDSLCKTIPGLNEGTVSEIINKVHEKVQRGIKQETDQIYYHTGPHHDDIMLGMMPHVIHLIREPSNAHHFANMTSGFTSVTNGFVVDIMADTLSFFEKGKIQMTDYPDFFSKGYKRKWDKDVFHYLDNLARRDQGEQNRAMAHRVIRALIEIYNIPDKVGLEGQIKAIISELKCCYNGEKNSVEVQKLKGMIREYEEELVWANYGVRVQDIHHLRLGFYTGDIFTESPERTRDVLPILEQFRGIRPTVISLALDPEGSGPDTHYKVLQAIADAVRVWNEEANLSHLRIWGYRNIWYRFDLAEADLVVPVTLNSMAIIRSTFMNCYLSQRDASFPSYELDGPFCDLSQKIWVEQHQDLQLLLGRDYWYLNENPHLRAVHGAVYLKEMDVKTFLTVARELEDSMEGSALSTN